MTEVYSSSENDLTLVRKVMVCHAGVETAIQRIQRCYNGARLGGDPRGLLIIGESGTGKSRILEHFENKYASKREKEGLLNPVILTKILPKPTVKGLAEDLLDKLGDPLFDSGTERAKTKRIRKLIKATGVRLLMLDEFQHFVDQGSLKVQHHVADWLKILVEDTNVSLIVAGLPYCTSVIETNPQLKRRFQAPLVMPRFNWRKLEHRNEFCSILATLQNSLAPFKFPDLSTDEMAFRIYCVSGGLIGRVANLFIEATSNAIYANKTEITFEDLGKAAIIASYDMPLGINPFYSEFNSIPTQEVIDTAMRIGVTDVPILETPKRRRRSNDNLSQILVAK